MAVWYLMSQVHASPPPRALLISQPLNTSAFHLSAPRLSLGVSLDVSAPASRLSPFACTALDVSGLDQIECIDAEAGTLRAGAGAKLGDIEDAARAHGWELRQHPRCHIHMQRLDRAGHTLR